MRCVLNDHSKIAQNGSQEFSLRKEGIQQQSRINVLLEVLQHRPAQRGLSCTDVPVNNNETLTARYAITEEFECANVRGTVIKELRIRCQAERGLTKSVEFFVHLKNHHIAGAQGRVFPKKRPRVRPPN